ncbi:MAG: M20/M25/M40 family metallo-hydrolase [Phycisphaerales bacterium]|nr:M20/M25/M40 family metallo-hydrolase [Phycisphaerales bacterium]
MPGANVLTDRIESHLAAEARRRSGAMTEDLREFVGMPTFSGYPEGLDAFRDVLRRRLEALGARVELVPGAPRPDWLWGGAAGGPPPPTLVARGPAPRCEAGLGERKRLLLSGHLDTVHPPQSPFRSLVISGSRATGPGCVDMKGGLVIALHALSLLKDAGEEIAWSMILNSDEETGSYHSEAALREQARAHDAGLVFEPALPNGGLVVERMGSGQFVLECAGRAAHVGRDFASGISAVTTMALAIVKVSEMSDPAAGRIVNIGPVEGGTGTNVVPDRARAWGNVRFSSPAQADALGAMLDALSTPENSIPGVKVRRSFNRPAKPRTPAVEAMASAARAVSEALGRELPFGVTGGVCDGNILQDAGLATLDTLGARGGGLHTPEEWVDLDSLPERAALVAVLMRRLAGGPE